MEMKIESFNDLVDYHASRIMIRLIEGGGKELKAAVFLAMHDAIQWEKENETKNNR